MKTFQLLLIWGCLLGSALTLFAQKPSHPFQADQAPLSLEELSNSIQLDELRTAGPVYQTDAPSAKTTLPMPLLPEVGEHIQMKANATTGLADWIRLPTVAGTPEEQCIKWFDQLANNWGTGKGVNSFQLADTRTDSRSNLHLRWQQIQDGIPVYGNVIQAHFRNGSLTLLNGRVFPEVELDTHPSLSAAEAVQVAQGSIKKHTKLKALNAQEEQLLGRAPYSAELVIYHPGNALHIAKLAYRVDATPNLAAHWQVMVDAQTGEVLDAQDHICHFLPPEGRAVASATDLNGQQVTIHSYEVGNTHFLVDASRTMHRTGQSNFPDNAVGVITTLNANGTSPINDDFTTFHNTSSGNFWNDRLAVSAHYNAGEAYQFFENTFERNSINGSGGNVYSIVNVTEDDGSDMDNAFWNGQAMFYGNGNEAFSSPLARALDVAGHEISHGVIQNTANLEYYGESGAINESFADVFAALIEDEDWRIGEDVVNTSIYRSGALRDMRNPNNGGNRLGDPGWQPAHVDEQYRGEADNAGVHINSGIPNRAFYLFAQEVGTDVAGEVFYNALDLYLTRSSQFLDLREAVLQAARDDFGQNVVDAAALAFATVGLGTANPGNGGGPSNPGPSDLDINLGAQYILFTEADNNDLIIQTPSGVTISDPVTTLDPFSKPSITDDGSFIVFVAQDRTLRTLSIDWVANRLSSSTLSSEPIWRNAAISRDGTRLAALVDDNDPSNDNQIVVFDLTRQGAPNQAFTLYNPTFTEGINTGDVQYADVLEWDHSGEFVVYDAFNTIPNQNGSQIEYWDIGFVRVWNRTTGNFGDGFVSKLFNGLPEGTSVGNPTFSKNSPYILALDLLRDGRAFLTGVNIEQGDVSTVFDNFILNYPNYAVLDDQLIFDAENSLNERVLGVVGLASDKITPTTDPSVFVSRSNDGARWGIWFANGQRVLVDTDDLVNAAPWAKVFPTTNDGQFTINWKATATGDNIHVELRDMLGRLHYQQAFDNTLQQTTLDVQLPTGIYLVHLQDGVRGYTQRIVVE